ncbi:MAG: maleylacetate reductase [Gemmatimonadota bacterium]
MSDRSSRATHLFFGGDAATHLPRVLAILGAERAFVVTTGGRSAAMISPAEILGESLCDVFSDAREHVPVDTVAAALARFDTARADVCIAIGGGSAIGLGKAIARARIVPLVAVPTTYSGSEMTSIWGETSANGKITGRDPAAKPRVVIYDIALTFGLPADVSAASGMNAIAHAVEAMYAGNATDTTRDEAAESVRLLSSSLPAIIVNGADALARKMAFEGAHLAGKLLDATSMGLHHRICHVLGGSFRLPHARTHACVLPHVVSFNAPAALDAMTRLGAAIGNADVAAGLAALNRTLGLTATLGDLGLRSSDVERAADEVTATPYPNPRPFSREDIRAILMGAL